ncbi:hypothetical protein H2201_008582 [Coniosporium apollinis]|uniref:Mis12 domain-containing protein n=2 Tax=Coniosporium TaxID=2810619 RepID=A0ABQ9NMF8_9PEZI|nr:hypothetical protein H2199_006989 [Cladosporium sp. JES 115]KAJ9656302.1 hypothetical protein H2201_008582 [Coniosporium apollinis]
MAHSSQMDSLLTEHFRYTPLTLIDDIINTVNELVGRAVDSVEAGLLSADPAVLGFAARAAAENVIPDTDGEGNVVYPEARKEIEEGVHKLETLLEATVDKNFDKLEIYVLRNVLTVPEELVGWVRLAHYENLHIPSPSAPPPPTPESLHLLRRKLHETQKLHSTLLAEHRRNTLLIAQLRSLLSASSTNSTIATYPKAEQASSPTRIAAPDGTHAGAFAFLSSTPAARTLGVSTAAAMPTPPPEGASIQTQAPLTTPAAFALAQLPALRQLLTSLRPRIASLGVGADDEGVGGVRRGYIEAQTRRVLERRGVGIE